jgi:hypothetical protein
MEGRQNKNCEQFSIRNFQIISFSNYQINLGIIFFQIARVKLLRINLQTRFQFHGILVFS